MYLYVIKYGNKWGVMSFARYALEMSPSKCCSSKGLFPWTLCLLYVVALSTPTQDMLLNYCLDLSYIQTGICKYHFTFLYEITIWLGANNTDAIINSTDLLIIPLNKNNIEGIIESANALKTLFFLKHIIQIAQ